MADLAGSEDAHSGGPKGAGSAISDILSQSPMRLGQYTLVCLVLGALLLDGLDLQLLSFVAPLILDEWGVSASEFGPTMSAALIGMTIGAPLGGWLGDRYGPKRVLVVSVIAFGLATFLAAFTDGVAQLLFLRFLGGLGFGAATPNGVALSAEWLAPTQRARIAAIMSMTTPLGGFAGAAAVGAMLPFVGWRGAFLVFGATTLLLALVLWLTAPEAPSYNIRHGRVGQAAQDMRKMLNLAQPVEIRIADSDGRHEPAIWSSGLLRFNVGIGISFFAMAFINFSILSWLPTLLESRGFPIQLAIRGSLFYNLGALIAALLASVVVPWTGTKILLCLSSAATVLLLILLGVALSLPTSWSFAAWSAGILGLSATLGFATGTTGSTIFMLMATGYPSACRGTGVGYGVMTARLAGIITIILSGYLLDLAKGSLVPFFAALAGMGIIGVAGCYVVDRHLGRHARFD